MLPDQGFNTNTKSTLASCSLPSFSEGNVMHEQDYLNQLQALDFTAAGGASYINGDSSQAANQRLDLTRSFSGSCG